MHVYVHAFEGQRLTSAVFFFLSMFATVMIQSLSLNPELADADRPPRHCYQCIPCSFFSYAGIICDRSVIPNQQ